MANNPLDMYNSFSSSTQIKFLHGSQANINTMITSGTAIEGAFYLADDTQKLYVGRKDKNNASKIYPVQVSRGVTIVANTHDLPINLNANNTQVAADSWAIEEGELYYITDSNILAALRINPNDPSAYEWVQVNPPTGLTGINYDYSDQAQLFDGINVIESELQITTQASTKAQTASQLFVGGNNVTVTNTVISRVTDNSTNPPTMGDFAAIQINAIDTEYAIGANTITDGAIVGLYKNQEIALDSNINFISKSNSIDISYNNANFAVEFNGPTLSSVSIESGSGSNGFTVGVTMNNGRGAQTVRTCDIDPLILYGQNGSKSTQHFQAQNISDTEFIIADLDVYTTSQTDNAIATAINARLQTADALSYKGTVYYDDIGPNARSYFTDPNRVVSVGDVYKISLQPNEVVTIGSGSSAIKVKNGDLIIFNGRNTYSNVIDSNAFTTSPGAVYEYMDVIPSGNETELAVSLGQISNGAQLVFSNTARGSTVAETIFATEILGGNLISVDTNNAQGANAITISHSSPGTRTDITNYLMDNVVNESATFGTNTYKFFALAPNIAEAIQTDSFGHVTSVKGQEIVFKHNRLDSLVTSYSDQDTYASNVSFSITPTDTLGALPGVSADINIVSNTLKFTSNDTAAHFAVDLVWESF